MLERGVMCILIGAAVLIAPNFLQSPTWRDMVSGAYIVGWFAVVLGWAAIMALRVRGPVAQEVLWQSPNPR